MGAPRRIITERGLVENLWGFAYHVKPKDNSRVLGILTRESDSRLKKSMPRRVVEEGDTLIPQGAHSTFHAYRVEFRDEETLNDPYLIVDFVKLSSNSIFKPK
jgi:hypothetical protein